jgi:hypothetical protein
VNDKWHKILCSKHNSSYLDTTADTSYAPLSIVYTRNTLPKETPVGTKHKFTLQNIYKAILIELKTRYFRRINRPELPLFRRLYLLKADDTSFVPQSISTSPVYTS